MAKRRQNYRLVKIHRSYTVEETAIALGIHKNTVRGWIKAGLPTCDDRRPTLILGRHLHEFLKSQRQKHKRTCSAGQIYCVRCRIPVEPAGAMADLVPQGPLTGDLVGICPHCDAFIYRRVSLARLSAVRGVLDIQQPKALQHIGVMSNASVNSDFK